MVVEVKLMDREHYHIIHIIPASDEYRDATNDQYRDLETGDIYTLDDIREFAKITTVFRYESHKDFIDFTSDYTPKGAIYTFGSNNCWRSLNIERSKAK
jgi:hypothetical protein